MEGDNYLEARAAILTRFIKEVGFPVLAYLLLFYMCMVTLQENTRAIEDLTTAINMRIIP